MASILLRGVHAREKSTNGIANRKET